MEVSRCRSCRAPMIWVTMASGKRMPVDEEESPIGHVLVWEHRGRVEGAHVTDNAAPPRDAIVTRHNSHFATCPDSKSWRKKP